MSNAKRTFTDRRDAGRVLGQMLTPYRGRDTIVLALPRGGIPVGVEVAAALGAPLDVLIVRKLGVPGHEEYAMGAIAGGGQIIVDKNTVSTTGVSPEELDAVIEREQREVIRRENTYRSRHLTIVGKTVILVDDGIATGATMRAAIGAVRQQAPGQLVVAVPVAPRSAFRQIGPLVDRFVVVASPSRFAAVGESYRDFHQVTDDEVRALLVPVAGE